MTWPIDEIARALGVPWRARGDRYWYDVDDAATGTRLRLELQPRRRRVRLCVDGVARGAATGTDACQTGRLILERVTEVEVLTARQTVSFRTRTEPASELTVSGRATWRTVVASDALAATARVEEIDLDLTHAALVA